ncbi:MAG: diaminopimelate epimerase [Mariniblastus sp.]
MQFTKMHGAGNDYVYVDCFKNQTPSDPAKLAIAVADRHKGIGGDGLILICPSDVADAQMRMFNADGSEAEMCGNGIRCVAKYVYDHGICRKDHLKIETGAGILALDLEAENGKVLQVRVDMGEPILLASEIPTTLIGNPNFNNQIVDVPYSAGGHEFLVTCVSMGNPHCVIFVDKATDELVLKVGPLIENDPRFPARTNVEFIEIVSPTEVRQRTWERGSGETMACGTGASAVCVAGVLSGRTERKLLNHLSGGSLSLEWDETTNRVFKTGPATEVFSGTWDE